VTGCLRLKLERLDLQVAEARPLEPVRNAILRLSLEPEPCKVLVDKMRRRDLEAFEV
jgi:hypothetical protein